MYAVDYCQSVSKQTLVFKSLFANVPDRMGIGITLLICNADYLMYKDWMSPL